MVFELRRVLLLGASIAVAACAGHDGSRVLPTSEAGQGQAALPTGTGAPGSTPAIVMESSDGDAPAGFVPSFRVRPRPDEDGVIRGYSPLTVEFDLCNSTPDAGKTLHFFFDWTFDHRPDTAGTGDACRQEHTYRLDRGSSEAQGFETNVCVVNGDPRGPGRESLYFSCRSYRVALPAPPTRRPNVAPGVCAGTLFDPGNGVTGCWYTAPALGMTCGQVCASHGGFDSVASQHTGNAVGFLFWPAKANGSNWVTIECSSTDNNTNWGATGNAPDANFSHPACYVNCACTQ